MLPYNLSFLGLRVVSFLYKSLTEYRLFGFYDLGSKGLGLGVAICGPAAHVTPRDFLGGRCRVRQVRWKNI